MTGSNHDRGLMAPAVDGSALVDEPGRTEGMTVARATGEKDVVAYAAAWHRLGELIRETLGK